MLLINVIIRENEMRLIKWNFGLPPATPIQFCQGLNSIDSACFTSSSMPCLPVHIIYWSWNMICSWSWLIKSTVGMLMLVLLALWRTAALAGLKPWRVVQKKHKNNPMNTMTLMSFYPYNTDSYFARRMRWHERKWKVNREIEDCDSLLASS